MSGRYGEITARIGAVRQLGAVVNAMRGIAGARAAQARAALAAVDGHAAVIAAAIRRVLALAPLPAAGRRGGPGRRTALVVFGSQQGFAGAFSEHVFDALGVLPEGCDLFLVGARAGTAAAERGLVPVWQADMPPHPPGIPRLADRITEALFARIAAGEIDALEAVWAADPGEGDAAAIHRQRLFPLAPADFAAARDPAPLTDLAPEVLLQDLTGDYIHAQLCMAALHAFAAENSARMQAMAAAHGQIERRLADLQAAQRQIRQEEITSEIIELASGERAARGT